MTCRQSGLDLTPKRFTVAPNLARVEHDRDDHGHEESQCEGGNVTVTPERPDRFHHQVTP